VNHANGDPHHFADPNRRKNTMPVIKHENMATSANVFRVVSFVATCVSLWGGSTKLIDP
jgi:hypothetical protein